MSFMLSKICLPLSLSLSLSLSFSNRHLECRQFLVKNVRIISGMSGIYDLTLECQL